MGEWYDYKIRFANNEGRNLANEMVAKGVAEKRMTEVQGREVESFWIKLKEMSDEFTNGYHNDNLEQIEIGFEEDGSVYYVNKWIPDDRLAFAISKHFEEPIYVSCKYTGGSDAYCWYEKGGDFCTKDGKEVKGSLFMVSPNLLKEMEDEFQIRLPIGDENAKWGSFTLPKENVAYRTYSYEDTETHEIKTEKYGVSIFFDKEKIPVSFRGREIEMDVSDIERKFYQSKEDFRNEMTKPVILEVPAEKVTKFRKTQSHPEFFIVEILCTREHSSNGKISFSVPIDSVKDAGNGNYVVNIGEKGKSHKVYYYESSSDSQTASSEDRNRRKTVEIKNPEIANIFREGVALCPELYNESVRNQTHANVDVYRTLPYVDEEMQANYGNPRSEEQDNEYEMEQGEKDI